MKGRTMSGTKKRTPGHKSAKRKAAEVELQREADRLLAIERERRAKLPADNNERLFVYKGAAQNVDIGATKNRMPAQLKRELDQKKAEEARKAGDPSLKSLRLGWQFDELKQIDPKDLPSFSFQEYINGIDRNVREHDDESKERRRPVNKSNAEQPRPASRKLGDGHIKALVKKLRACGVSDRKLTSELQKELAFQGEEVSRPTVRASLKRLRLL
jgi:hypothetical protein